MPFEQGTPGSTPASHCVPKLKKSGFGRQSMGQRIVGTNNKPSLLFLLPMDGGPMQSCSSHLRSESASPRMNPPRWSSLPWCSWAGYGCTQFQSYPALLVASPPFRRPFQLPRPYSPTHSSPYHRKGKPTSRGPQPPAQPRPGIQPFMPLSADCSTDPAGLAIRYDRPPEPGKTPRSSLFGHLPGQPCPLRAAVRSASTCRCKYRFLDACSIVPLMSFLSFLSHFSISCGSSSCVRPSLMAEPRCASVMPFPYAVPWMAHLWNSMMFCVRGPVLMHWIWPRSSVMFHVLGTTMQNGKIDDNAIMRRHLPSGVEAALSMDA